MVRRYHWKVFSAFSQVDIKIYEGQLQAIMDGSGSKFPGRRKKVRRRTRLRSGKIADTDGRFITECQIFDRSKNGARLRMVDACSVPDHLKLFDDELDILQVVVVVWADGAEIGVEFLKGPGSVEEGGPVHVALGGRYYAVK